MTFTIPSGLVIFASLEVGYFFILCKYAISVASYLVLTCASFDVDFWLIAVLFSTGLFSFSLAALELAVCDPKVDSSDLIADDFVSEGDVLESTNALESDKFFGVTLF